MRFYLYTTEVLQKNFEWVNGKPIKLEAPIPTKNLMAWRHSFPSPLRKVIKDWGCLVQILKFQRFYHSVCGMNMKQTIDCCTKFPVILLPIVYVYSIFDTWKFHKIGFIK